MNFFSLYVVFTNGTFAEKTASKCKKKFLHIAMTSINDYSDESEHSIPTKVNRCSDDDFLG